MRSYKLTAFVLLFLLGFIATVQAQPSGTDVVKKCIERHGGWQKFQGVRDFYAKMDIVSKTDKGEVESRVHQFFRLPNRLRAEIEPLIEPPTKISWDGKDAWQLVKDKMQKTDNQRQIDRLQESLRFLKLMVLTNLFEKGAKMEYEKYLKPKGKSYGIHIVGYTDSNGEKIKLYISDQSYTLMGGESVWQGATFKIFFDKHGSIGGFLLPKRTRLYRGSQLIMTAKLRLAKMNALANGHSFFSDLTQKPKWLK